MLMNLVVKSRCVIVDQVVDGHLIHVCMWDDFAKHFMDSFSKVNDDRVFVVVKYGRIKPAHEEQLDDVNPTQQSSQFSQGSQLTQQTDIMSKVNFLTLSEVNHVQHETVCVTIAKIEMINANKFGWTYDGCNFCGKAVHLDNGELKCTSNHINEKPRKVEEEERVGEDGVINGGVWKAIYREGWVKNGWEAINAVKKRVLPRFFDLTTDKNVWCRPLAITDAFQNIKSGMHICFPEYIFRINAIMVNERKVDTSCRAKGVPATVFLSWTGGKRCSSDLILKYSGLITFDSRSGVNSLIQVWFWAFLMFFRWTGGRT
ncbi:hypothetical protein MTR_8g077280 [Medicago truncatula]|uniref:Nucleic acid-binding protein n=1 Tax=Medicago truncatula TaxID=3880 RepID=G7LDX8_MEDTR|nr:hypothetical protein MTR_8g077280 [Medicago truncatula]